MILGIILGVSGVQFCVSYLCYGGGLIVILENDLLCVTNWWPGSSKCEGIT